MADYRRLTSDHVIFIVDNDMLEIAQNAAWFGRPVFRSSPCISGDWHVQSSSFF